MQLNAFPHVDLCKYFCTESRIIIIKAVLCILRQLSYLCLVIISLRVEEAYPVQPNYFHRSQGSFFLSSQFISELTCTE